MEGEVFHTHTFLDANEDTWQIDFVNKGARIVYHGHKYFVPSRFVDKEVIMELNGELDVLALFIPKPGVVPEMDDLFEFLEDMCFYREGLESPVVKYSPTRLSVS